jgi:hypothetical protein
MSNPFEATAATFAKDVRRMLPEGFEPLWHPVQVSCMKGQSVPEKVTGLIVSQTSPQFSLKAP